MEKQSDVLIIGGGVIGVCAAYYLSGDGRRVTLVEQGDLAAGSSYGNAGLVVPSHSIPLANPGALSNGLKWLLDPESPFYVRPRLDPGLLAWLLRFISSSRKGAMRRGIPVLRDLSMASRKLFDELSALSGLSFGYHQKGALSVFKTRRGFASGKEEAHLMQTFGLRAQVLDAAQVRKMAPGLKPDIVGGVLFPDDAHLNPAEFVRRLGRLAEAKGILILTKTEVLGFEAANRKISAVQTTRGDFHPEQVVLAAGAWSPGLARSLHLRLPLQPAKGYSVTVKRPKTCPSIPLLLGEARVAVTPFGDMLRFAGTLELAGYDHSINQRRLAAILRAACAYLTGMEELEMLEIWRGWRPCTPDGLPLVGRAPNLQNLIIAAGHGMLGMSLGPITGSLIRQLLHGEQPGIDLTPLRVERFL